MRAYAPSAVFLCRKATLSARLGGNRNQVNCRIQWLPVWNRCRHVGGRIARAQELKDAKGASGRIRTEDMDVQGGVAG